MSTFSWSAKNPDENNKNQAKKLKAYEFFFDFHRPLPPKVYRLYTLENVDIYGRSLILYGKSRVICTSSKLKQTWPSTTCQETAFCSILA